MNGNVYRNFSQDASPNVFCNKPENGNYVLRERSLLIWIMAVDFALISLVKDDKYAQGHRK
jgi:hypothetical protein